jgi:hypothetical protein
MAYNNLRTIDGYLILSRNTAFLEPSRWPFQPLQYPVAKTTLETQLNEQMEKKLYPNYRSYALFI